MSLAFLIKLKPLIVPASGVAVASWGYYQWDAASKQLKLDFLSDKDIDVLFDSIDQDHSGQISEEELRKALSIKLTNFSLHAMIASADQDHNGELDRKEFRDLVHRIQHAHHTEYHAAPADQKRAIVSALPSHVDDPKQTMYLKAQHDTALRIKRRTEPSQKEIRQIKEKVGRELGGRHDEGEKGRA